MPPHPHQPLAATNLFWISVDSPSVDMGYKWNHKICGSLFWLASFQGFLISKVYTCFILYQSIILLPNIFHCIATHYIYPSSVMDIGVISTLWLLGIMFLWTYMYQFLCGHICISLEYIPRRTLLGHWWCLKFHILDCWHIRYKQGEKTYFIKKAKEMSFASECGRWKYIVSVCLNMWCGTV